MIRLRLLLMIFKIEAWMYYKLYNSVHRWHISLNRRLHKTIDRIEKM